MDELLDALIRTGIGNKKMGVSRTTAWRREQDDPDFPKRLQIGPNSFAYRVSDVKRWIATRPVHTPRRER